MISVYIMTKNNMQQWSYKDSFKIKIVLQGILLLKTEIRPLPPTTTTSHEPITLPLEAPRARAYNRPHHQCRLQGTLLIPPETFLDQPPTTPSDSAFDSSIIYF